MQKFETCFSFYFSFVHICFVSITVSQESTAADDSISNTAAEAMLDSQDLDFAEDSGEISMLTQQGSQPVPTPLQLFKKDKRKRYGESCFLTRYFTANHSLASNHLGTPLTSTV